jgi:hypothetical protein
LLAKNVTDGPVGWLRFDAVDGGLSLVASIPGSDPWDSGG